MYSDNLAEKIKKELQMSTENEDEFEADLPAWPHSYEIVLAFCLRYSGSLRPEAETKHLRTECGDLQSVKVESNQAHFRASAASQRTASERNNDHFDTYQQ